MTDELLAQLQVTLGPTYQFDRELGGGGMSRVFLSTETALERKLVLKVLPPDLASSVSVDRFKREISLAARLQHAHIVSLLATGDANGLPWFATPFVDGESLRARLGHGELPIAEVVRTLRDVASALAYAHGKGVVHRDIKPENILIAEGSVPEVEPWARTVLARRHPGGAWQEGRGCRTSDAGSSDRSVHEWLALCRAAGSAPRLPVVRGVGRAEALAGGDQVAIAARSLNAVSEPRTNVLAFARAAPAKHSRPAMPRRDVRDRRTVSRAQLSIPTIT